MSLTVTHIDDSAALRALEPAWWTLWRSLPRATPFQSPAWLCPWWEAFAPGQLRALALWQGERLVGLAPLYLEKGPHGRRLLPLGMSVSDYLDLLLAPDRAQAAMATLLRALEALPWEEWELTELPPGAAAFRLPCPPGWGEERSGASPCLALPLRGTLAESLPKGQARKLRMARHRLARRGAHRFLTAEAANLPALLQALQRLHGKRWAERDESGVLADDAVVRFHRAAAPRLLAAGLLRMSALEIEGRLAGVLYALRHRHCLYAYLLGFDPDFAFESPGTLLLARAVEDALAEGATRLDFLRGEEAYKLRWGATAQPNGRRVFRRAAAEAHA